MCCVRVRGGYCLEEGLRYVSILHVLWGGDSEWAVGRITNDKTQHDDGNYPMADLELETLSRFVSNDGSDSDNNERETDNHTVNYFTELVFRLVHFVKPVKNSKDQDHSTSTYVERHNSDVEDVVDGVELVCSSLVGVLCDGLLNRCHGV